MRRARRKQSKKRRAARREAANRPRYYISKACKIPPPPDTLDCYIPTPELKKIREEVQTLINIEKKRIRQSYLTTRTGKSVQDA